MRFYYEQIIQQNLVAYNQLKQTENCTENFQCVTNCFMQMQTLQKKLKNFKNC